MGALILFTGIGLALFACALAALWWTVRSGQLDDLDTPALRMLGEDLPAHGAQPPAPSAPGPTLPTPRQPLPAPKP